MKKFNFTKVADVIRTVYHVTMILSCIGGVVMWFKWWMDYKKFLQRENADREFDKEFPICNDVLDKYKDDPTPTRYDDWQNTKRELDQTCTSLYDTEDDRELY